MIENWLSQMKYLKKNDYTPYQQPYTLKGQNKLDIGRPLLDCFFTSCPFKVQFGTLSLLKKTVKVSLEIVLWNIPLELPLDLLASRSLWRNWEAKPGGRFGGRSRSGAGGSAGEKPEQKEQTPQISWHRTLPYRPLVHRSQKCLKASKMLQQMPPKFGKMQVRS